jgi:rhodanese-related sulfurtransferase
MKTFLPTFKTVGITSTEADRRIEREDLLVLDVRQPDEYKTGHIPGSKLIPLVDLGRHIDDLPKDREILCVCLSGARSSAASRQLSDLGFKAVYLEGGILSWMGKGFPVQRGK